MRKRKVGLHLLALLAMAGFVFLAFSSGATAPATKTSEETTSSTTTSKGVVNDMPVPQAPAQKQFTSLGIVFATSVSKFDENGVEISSQEGIVTLLLREAQKLGADDILNLRTDENTTFTTTTTATTVGTTNPTTNVGTATPGSNVTSSKTAVTTKTVTTTGSALAIKYVD